MATSHETAGPPIEGLLKDRYEAVKQRIESAARRAGRDAGEIILVAVTKNASIDQIREMIDLGHVDFGENRVKSLVQRAAQVDEYLERRRQLGTDRRPRSVRWHMIGNIQRNKVRKVVGRVRLIHSVGSLRLAEEIQVAAARLDEPVEVLVQVKTSGEESKQGIVPAAARHLVEQIDTMLNLRPRGLMCLAPLTDDSEPVRAAFQLCHEIFEDVRRAGFGGERFDILSMGMSNDLELAIECGANVVRVGTDLFGAGSDSGADEDDEDEPTRRRR